MRVQVPAQQYSVILCDKPYCALKELQALQLLQCSLALPCIGPALHCKTMLMFGTAVDNDLMTPSFKLKRPQLQKHYQKQIDEMYKEAKKGM